MIVNTNILDPGCYELISSEWDLLSTTVLPQQETREWPLLSTTVLPQQETTSNQTDHGKKQDLSFDKIMFMLSV